MSNFKIHSVESAPEQSKLILEGTKNRWEEYRGCLVC